MRGETMRLAGLVVAALIVLATGVLLTQGGRPYGTALLTAHKLVALGAVVVVGVVAYRAHQAAALGTAQLAVLGAALVLAVAAFATGGVISGMRETPAAALWVHRVGSWLAAAMVAAGAWVVR